MSPHYGATGPSIHDSEYAMARPDAKPVLLLVMNTLYMFVLENWLRAPGARYLDVAWDVHLLCGSEDAASTLDNVLQSFTKEELARQRERPAKPQNRGDWPARLSLEADDAHRRRQPNATPAVSWTRGFYCRQITRDSFAAETYTQRIAYVSRLLRRGRHVLFSDLDALWIREPWPYLQQLLAASGADILASQDDGTTGALAQAVRTWGSSL